MSACWRGKEKPRGPGAARGKSGRAGREMALPAVWRSAGFGGTELTRPEYLRQWVCFTLQVVDFKYKPKAAFYTGRGSVDPQGLHLAPAAFFPRQLPVVVEQRRFPVAVGGIGQHEPALPDPAEVGCGRPAAAGRGIGQHVQEVGELVAELHQHPVLAGDLLAPATLFRTHLLAAFDKG